MDKKILTALTTLTLLITPVLAENYVNYSSSYSYSTSSSTSNQSWSFKIDKRGSKCSNNSERLRNVSFRENGVSFVGSLEVPTPCRMLETEVQETGDRIYAVKISSEPAKVPCVQCIGKINYKASFNSSEPYKLRLYHEGTLVETFEHPEFDNNSREFNQTSITPLNETQVNDSQSSLNQTVEASPENPGGLFERIFSWFGAFF